MSEIDLYINQILHYWFGYLPSNNENIIKGEVEPSKLVKARELNLVDDEMIEKLFIEKREFKNENNSFFTSLQQKF